MGFQYKKKLMFFFSVIFEGGSILFAKGPVYAYKDTLSHFTHSQGNFHAFSLSADFLSWWFLKFSCKYQTAWIQLGFDVLLGPIWIQTVCKSYQQTTQVSTCDCDNSQ